VSLSSPEFRTTTADDEQHRSGFLQFAWIDHLPQLINLCSR